MFYNILLFPKYFTSDPVINLNVPESAVATLQGIFLTEAPCTLLMQHLSKRQKGRELHQISPATIHQSARTAMPDDPHHAWAIVKETDVVAFCLQLLPCVCVVTQISSNNILTSHKSTEIRLGWPMSTHGKMRSTIW